MDKFMESNPELWEKNAHELFAQGKAGQAYDFFKKAGDIYKQKNLHKEAALCLASAASCWAIKTGEKAFHNSSLAYEEAAKESELAGDLEYASLLYRQAAVNYERDMEFASFSECFYNSRECLRRFLFRSLITRKEVHYIGISGIKKKGSYGILKRIGLFIFLTLSSLVWGHGERPNRTFYSAILLNSLSAVFYTFGRLVNNVLIFKPNFLQAFYFSVVTFTTVGYGDITASGFTKIIACLEAFCGIFVIPIFIVGLSRKYLRI